MSDLDTTTVAIEADTSDLAVAFADLAAAFEPVKAAMAELGNALVAYITPVLESLLESLGLVDPSTSWTFDDVARCAIEHHGITEVDIRHITLDPPTVTEWNRYTTEVDMSKAGW